MNLANLMSVYVFFRHLIWHNENTLLKSHAPAVFITSNSLTIVVQSMKRGHFIPI